MKATIRSQIEAETKAWVEEAFERLEFERVGLNIASNYSIRKKGKLWLAEQIITTTPNECYEEILANYLDNPAKGWRNE